jgi:hypothetical protein
MACICLHTGVKLWRRDGSNRKVPLTARLKLKFKNQFCVAFFLSQDRTVSLFCFVGKQQRQQTATEATANSNLASSTYKKQTYLPKSNRSWYSILYLFGTLACSSEKLVTTIKLQINTETVYKHRLHSAGNQQ